ncbi:MAG: MoaD/ThiS family protein [Candidatus Promineifilaceae bacterium]|nr:MoaD/ThiS family protein [Candidatus Promineifilaceae bacterium]
MKLYGALRQRRPKAAAGEPHQPFSMTLPPDCTLADLADLLSIPDGLINAAARNGEAVGLDARLHDGDRVSFFPPAAGG